MIGRKCLLYILLSSFLWANAAKADVASDMSKFWKSSGGTYNITSPGSYMSQSGGYITLGGMQARAPIRNTSIANVSLPSIRAGCGGIDIYSGGFSFINSQQLVQTLKAIGQNAVGYAFKLALEDLSPTISGVVSDLQGWADKINQFNMNSCQQSKLLVGSMFDKNDVLSGKICEDIGTKQGFFVDRVAAKLGCSTGGKRNSTLGNAKGELKDKVVWNTNVAWKILRNNPTFKNNDRLAELAMSLTGTIIPLAPKGDAAGRTIRRLPSLGLEGTKEDIFAALMYGTKSNSGTEIYHCVDKVKCLNPGLANIAVSKSTAFVPKIRLLLVDIQQQLETGCRNKSSANKCFTDEEHDLIENVSFPLYKLLNAYSIYGQSIGATPTSYTDIVAFDMVFNYIKGIIRAVVRETDKDISDSPVTKEYIDDLEKVQVNLRSLYAQKLRSLNMTLDLIQRIEMVDKRVRADLSATLQNKLHYEERN